jgi:hypothetical protein
LPTYALREAARHDAAAIGILLRTVEGEDISPERYAEWWSWLFEKNPNGTGRAYVGESSAGEVIGHYGLVPFRFLMGTAQRTGGFVCQLFVHEEYREELVFPRLELTLLKCYERAGCDFAYGLINRPRVLEAHLAFGFRPHGRYDVLARPVDPAALAKRLRPTLGTVASPLLKAGASVLHRWPRAPARITLRSADNFSVELEPLLATVQQCLGVSALRTTETLTWRFVSAPRWRDYRILTARDGDRPGGYVVLRPMSLKGIPSLAIVDLVYDLRHPQTGRALIRGALTEARRCGAELLATLVGEDGVQRSLLRRSGFMRTPESFTLIIHTPKNVNRSMPGFDSPWHLTWFDHDYV